MAKLRILYSNKWSASTSVLIASSAASALPGAASQNPQRTYPWRSLSQNGEQALDVDLGSVQEVSCIAVANVRLLSGGALKLQHRGDAGAAGAAVDVVTLPTQDTDSRVALAFPTASSHRHWRLLWTNPGAVTDYAEIGYVHLGGYYEATVNFSVPSEGEDEDASVATPSLDGQKDFARRTPYATGRCDFIDVAEAQLADFRTIKRTVGAHTPFFLVMDTSLAWSAWLCRVVGGLYWRFGVMPARYTVWFDWEEAR